MKAASKAELSTWIAQRITAGATEVQTYRVTRTGPEMIGANETDERPAAIQADEIWGVAEDDAAIMGGTSRYELKAFGENGQPNGPALSLTFVKDQAKSEDAATNALSTMILRMSKATSDLFDRYERRLDASHAREDELHRQVVESQKATEKALSKSHKREMKAYKQKTHDERVDKVVSTLTTTVVPFVATKAGMPKEMVLQMFGQAKNGEAANKKLETAVKLLSLVPDEMLEKILEATGDEGKALFVQLMTPEG